MYLFFLLSKIREKEWVCVFLLACCDGRSCFPARRANPPRPPRPTGDTNLSPLPFLSPHPLNIAFSIFFFLGGNYGLKYIIKKKKATILSENFQPWIWRCFALTKNEQLREARCVSVPLSTASERILHYRTRRIVFIIADCSTSSSPTRRPASLHHRKFSIDFVWCYLHNSSDREKKSHFLS